MKCFVLSFFLYFLWIYDVIIVIRVYYQKWW